MSKGNTRGVERIGRGGLAVYLLVLVHVAHAAVVMWLAHHATVSIVGHARPTTILLCGVVALLPVAYLRALRNAYLYLAPRGDLQRDVERSESG